MSCNRLLQNNRGKAQIPFVVGRSLRSTIAITGFRVGFSAAEFVPAFEQDIKHL